VLFSVLIFIGLLIRKERTSEAYYEDTDIYSEHVDGTDSDDGHKPKNPNN